MDPTRFDRLTKLLAGRGMSRRQALRHGGVGLAAGALAATGYSAAAQDATSAPDPAAPQPPSFLFVQAFQGGSIAPKSGEEGVYTLTLEHGMGQTVYFADRPNRDVGAMPTPQFLALPLFAGDNPPNAALVVEPAPGETDVVVVELLNPTFDDATGTLTYDVIELANYRDTLTLGLVEEPTDLAALLPTFGSAHLFIDSGDVPFGDLPCSPEHPQVYCYRGDTQIGWLGVGHYVWNPCHDLDLFQGCRNLQGCRNEECNETYPAECQGECYSMAPELVYQGRPGGNDCTHCAP